MWIYPITKTTHLGTQIQVNAFTNPESAELFCEYQNASMRRYSQNSLPMDGLAFTYHKAILENATFVPYGYRYKVLVQIITTESGKKSWRWEVELIERCESRFDCIHYVNLKREESSFSFETTSQYELHSLNKSINPNAFTISDKLLSQLIVNMVLELGYIELPNPEICSFEIRESEQNE